jgi:hypothetical protein
MIRKIRLALGVLALAAAAPAVAQDSLLEYVVNSCEADLKQYCSQVTPGECAVPGCVAARAAGGSDRLRRNELRD